MATFTPNAIASAYTNEYFTMELTQSGSATFGKNGYAFIFEYTINGITVQTDKIAKKSIQVLLPDNIVNDLLTSHWNTKNVTGSWRAYIYYKGSLDTTTGSANIGFVIADYGHTVSVTIEDANPTTLALTGDSSKFIYPYSIPKVTAVIGHVNANDKSAITYYDISVYSPPESDGNITSEYSEGTFSPIAGQTSQTVTNTFSYPSQYRADISYRDSRGYTGSSRYQPDTWSGSTYYQPYMVANGGFYRISQDSTTVKLACQPHGWLQSFGAQNNTLTLTIQVKEYGEADSAYVTANTITISSNPSAVTEYTVNHTFLVNKNYVCRWILTDALGSVYGAGQNVTTSYPVFAISDSRMDVFGDFYVHNGDIYHDDIGSLIDSLFYKNGDTYETGASARIPITAYLVDSGKTIRVTIPVPKSLKKITSVTVTTMKGALLGDSGYINSTNYNTDWLNQTGVTASAAIIDDRTVRIDLTSTSNYTNTSRVLVYSPYNGGLVLTFGGV